MKKRKILFISAITALMLCGSFSLKQAIEEDELADNITYHEKTIAKIDQPDYVYAGDDEVPDVKKVILHYHNDDGKCGKDVTTSGSNGGRAFYIWVTGVDGIECMPDHVANEGQDMDITIDFSTEKFAPYSGKTALLFIIKYRKNSDTDLNWGGQSSDTELSYMEFQPDSNGVVEAWSTNASGSDVKIYHTEAETKVLGVKYAEFINWKTIRCTNTASKISYSVYAYDETFFKRDAKTRDQYKKWYLILTGEAQQATFDIVLPRLAHINMLYSIESLDKESTTGLTKTAYVTYDKLYETDRFEKNYTYSGNDLGVTYSQSQTTFKVWAPTAANMTLYTYGTGISLDFGGSNKYKAYHMNYDRHGVWTLTMQGNLSGTYYTYFVDNSSGSQETIDPYATACGLNGIRGYVYNKEYAKPEGWDDLPLVWDGVDGYDIETPQDLSVYEVHVQDFTGDESWNGTEKNGTYKAFVESGTHLEGHSEISTGYDHLNELGVKAVQLLPVFDHDNDETSEDGYNWGYNPQNYNCVEGAYSSDPTSPLARIREYKNLVLKMSQTDAHTRVIMDVVYNHVSRASASSFTKLMPKYYFRYLPNGEYANGSGCSNEVKTEATMMRKFIVDSVCMWATEYKIKGFRFDLMGLIDTETMRAVKDALYEIDPDIYVYGEGWTSIDGYNGRSGTHGADTASVYGELYPTDKSKGLLGCFNDCGRDALRGGNDSGWGSSSSLPTWGFMQRGDDASAEQRNKVANMIWGINADKGANPKQTVNYASCHDNWTVFDQFYYTLGDSGNGVPPSYKVVMDASTTAHALIMASNGVAFMQGGEEIFRTKELNAEERAQVSPTTYELMYDRYCAHNSYNAPLSVNSFKWTNKLSVKGVSYNGYFEAFKNAVKLHNTLPKLPFDMSGFPPSTTSAGNHIDNISWAGSGKNGNYEGSAGFQFDEYFIFAAGRCWAYVGSDASSWQLLYEFGEWKHGDYHNSVDLGNYDANTGGAIVVFKRKQEEMIYEKECFINTFSHICPSPHWLFSK